MHQLCNLGRTIRPRKRAERAVIGDVEGRKHRDRGPRPIDEPTRPRKTHPSVPHLKRAVRVRLKVDRVPCVSLPPVQLVIAGVVMRVVRHCETGSIGQLRRDL